MKADIKDNIRASQFANWIRYGIMGARAVRIKEVNAPFNACNELDRLATFDPIEDDMMLKDDTIPLIKRKIAANPKAVIIALPKFLTERKTPDKEDVKLFVPLLNPFSSIFVEIFMLPSYVICDSSQAA
jgi:hypothetical protein